MTLLSTRFLSLVSPIAIWLWDGVTLRRRYLRLVLFVSLLADGWQLRAAGTWWYIALLIAHAIGTCCGLWFLTRLDEAVMRTLADRIRERNAELAAKTDGYDHHSRALQKQIATLVKSSSDALRRAAISERSAERAEARAHQAYQAALDSSFETERVKEHWKGIAIQNADDGVKLAHVLLTRIGELAGDQEVAKAKEALDSFERSQN